MDIERFEDIVMAVFIGFFGIIGIMSFVGFLFTWMWHYLLFAVMCTAMVWAWYHEDYKSKGRKINTLWQKKNTKH